MNNSRKITESQVFHVVAKALTFTNAQLGRMESYTGESLKRDKVLYREVLTDFSVKGRIPVLHGCAIVMTARGYEREWSIEGAQEAIDNNLMHAFREN